MYKVLVIDDEPVLRATFKHILEESGYEVWVAENGVVGVDRCREIHPDLVITDIWMPEQDGFATIRILRDEFPDIRIIAMSAGARLEDGAIEDLCLVRKPIDATAMTALVAKTLQKRPPGPSEYRVN